MRETLPLDIAVIQGVKAKADWARHGGRGSISDAERVSIFKSTREFIRRYLDYVHGAMFLSPPSGIHLFSIEIRT